MTNEKNVRPPSFYVAATLGVVLVVGGIFWLLSSSNSNKQAQNTANTNTSSSADSNKEDSKKELPAVIDNPATVDDDNNGPTTILAQLGLKEAPADSACGLPPGDTDFEAKIDKKKLKWNYIGRTNAPHSDEFGGAERTDDGYYRCFQFSTQGAVLAAMNFIAAGQDVKTRLPLYENLTVNTGKPHEDSYKDYRDPPTFFGYKITNTFPDAVSVAVLEQAGGQDFQLTIPLKWVDGDWKVVTTDGDVKGDPIEVPGSLRSKYTLIY
jgi:hypothetical protein